MNEATESVREQIEYDLIIGEDGYDRELVDEAVAQMVEAICSTKPNIRVAGENRSADVVRSRLLELNRFHVEFVLDCMKENTTRLGTSELPAHGAVQCAVLNGQLLRRQSPARHERR